MVAEVEVDVKLPRDGLASGHRRNDSDDSVKVLKLFLCH